MGKLLRIWLFFIALGTAAFALAQDDGPVSAKPRLGLPVIDEPTPEPIANPVAPPNPAPNSATQVPEPAPKTGDTSQFKPHPPTASSEPARPTITSAVVTGNEMHPGVVSSAPAWETPMRMQAFSNPVSPYTMWAHVEGGAWFIRGSNLPPLLTISPPGTALASAGVLGSMGTTVVNADLVNREARGGGMATFGFWLDPEQTCAFEVSILAILGRTQNFSASSDGTQIIGRPFANALTGAETADLVSFPGVVAGSVVVSNRADQFTGAELLLRNALTSDGFRRLDFLVGYRSLRYGEDLTIQENVTGIAPATVGTNRIIMDQFRTRSEFYGGELGLQTQLENGPFSFQVVGKAAIGDVRRIVDIAGSTVVTMPGLAPVVSPGGLLALSSNSGRYISNTFGWVPELRATAGYQITPYLRATVGYTLLWWTNVVRPGDQIDRVVNPNLLPPVVATEPARPTFLLRDSDIWVQGLNLGMELRY